MILKTVIDRLVCSTLLSLFSFAFRPSIMELVGMTSEVPNDTAFGDVILAAETSLCSSCMNPLVA